MGDGGEDQRRDRHLQSAEKQHLPTHGQQMSHGKLQADGEHQKDDAHFGDFMEGMIIGRIQPIKGDHHRTGNDITDDGR